MTTTGPSACRHDEQQLHYHRCRLKKNETAAGVHALVIGVGQYAARRNPLKKRWFDEVLRGTAPAAAHFARFLRTDFRDPARIPLRTIRLLMTPAAGQEADEQYLPVGGLPCQAADRDTVVDALEDWSEDSDNHPDNVGVLYIAGHGVFTANEGQWAFLTQAGRVDTPYDQALNLAAIVDQMRVRRARTKIYIWDLCALPGALPPVTGSGIHLADPEPVPPGQARHGTVNEIFISPRIGTPMWSLSALEGTVMSQALVGRDTDEFHNRLMYRAAEFDKSGEYYVTPGQIQQRFGPVIREVLQDRAADVDVSVHYTRNDIGINRPDPRPKYKLRLHWQPPQSGQALQFRIVPRYATTPVEPGTRLHHGQVLTELLSAGVYSIKAAGQDFGHDVELTGDYDLDLATGKPPQ